MIPIHDDNPTRSVPYVNYTLIAINVAVFIYTLTLSDQAQSLFFIQWGARPIEYTQLGSVDQPMLTGVVAPLLTSLFIHGGWSHILGNMIFLWVFGDNVEDRFGHALYPLLYVALGLGALGAHIASAPTSGIPTVGASGAVSGILGAYIVFFPRARVKALIPIFVIFLFRELPAWVFIGLWFALQVANGLGNLWMTEIGSGVAWWAHIGGFAAGAVVGLIGRAVLGPPPPPERRL